MSDGKPTLYELLKSVQPENLTENAWASRAGVSRSWFNDVKRGGSPRSDKLEKVLAAIEMTPAQFYDLPNARDAAPPPRAERPEMTFRGRNEPMDVPLLGTAQGSDMEVGEDGTVAFVERMDLDASNIVEFIRRPSSLSGRRDIYGLTVIGTSMEPKFDEGDPVYVDPKRQPHAGDYVVVQLRKVDGEEERLNIALLKKLVRRTSTYIELEQLSPAVRFTVPLSSVHAVHRIVPWREIVFF